MNIWIELLTNLYDAILGVLFVTLFCKNSSKKTYITVFAIVFSFAISTMFTFVDAFSVIHSLLITLVLYVLSILIKPKEKIRLILAPIIFEISLLLVNTLFLTVFSHFFGLSVNELISNGSIARYLTILFSKILLTFILFVILKFTTLTSHFNVVNLMLYLFSPLFTSYILYLFIRISLSYDLEQFVPFVTIGIIGLAAINVFIIFLFESSNRNAEAKLKLDLLERETNHERELYEKLLAVNEDFHKIKHDIKNHLLYVRDIIDHNRIEEAEKYVQNLAMDLQNTERYMVTGNQTLDYILASKISDHEEITFICTGCLDSLEGFNKLDIAVIFGNLLDNAIEAVEKVQEKTIEIHLSSFNDYRNIIISNPINESVLDKNPKLFTTKKDKVMHGWGLKSVISIVDKYNGLFEYYEKNNKFTVHVALPLLTDN